MAKVRVVVDQNLCIGAATCVGTAPEFFQLDLDNKANVEGPGDDPFDKVLTVSDEEKEALELAAESCPVTAIQVKEV